MHRHGLFFDHNLHALRIVEDFELRYASFRGLNLTFEVREGIVKHSRDLPADAGGELEEFLPGLRPPLEAQLIDLADEIAYDTADLDDAFAAGLFDLQSARAALPELDELLETVEGRFPGASDRVQFQEVLRGLIDHLVSGLIEGTAAAAAEAEARDADAVRAHTQRLAQFTPETGQLARSLKRFLTERVYYSPALADERARSAAMIAELFELFLRRPELLPEGHREMLDHEPGHRVVCDYIAGMTDGFFQRTWEQYVPARAVIPGA
jgi:dGTPase